MNGTVTHLARARVEGDQTWQSQSACASEAPDVMFPINYSAENTADAKALCRKCPVVAECLRYALEVQEREGVWGGLTPDERMSLAKAEGRYRAPVPGRRTVSVAS